MADFGELIADPRATTTMAGTRLVVWQLSDGKRGHERQTEGLIAALSARVTVESHRIVVKSARFAYTLAALLRHFAEGAQLPAPHLIIGAGRACHWPLVSAQRAYGGRAICLMRPGLPTSWFDLCIVPRHDNPRASLSVETSEGPLNPMRPAAKRSNRDGVILVGGPSAHYAWDTHAIIRQIARIVSAAPDIDWVLTDSRRTPSDFAGALAAAPGPRPRFQPYAACAPDWLQQTLSCTGRAWVTADSVAMIYEALSAGAQVGLIEVPPRGRDRINAIADDLVRRGWVARLGQDVSLPCPRLDEAGRFADLILLRWPDLAARQQ